MLDLVNAYQKTIAHYIANVKDFDVVMPMYNPLEYDENYSMASGSLSNYYIDKLNDNANENNAAVNYRINNKRTTSKSFKY